MIPTPPTSGRTIQDVAPYADQVFNILAEIQALEDFDIEALRAILKKYPRDGNAIFSKNLLMRTYQHLVAQGRVQADSQLEARLRMKPVRTISGVAPVTVLTKPYPCPGKCIFCPTDVRMPKSYLPDEPGAMRAEQHNFDPYAQTRSRIETFASNGHATDKIELLILGGTWSSYRKDYQEWFIKRCLDAMNVERPPAETLAQAQQWNETARHRNVGLVIETRPDHVTPKELQWLRYLGVTKVQMGAQSLNDHILEMNKRGHTVAETVRAMGLLRTAGFKLVLHWMPNLHGATPQSDLQDFARLWEPGLCPDEIKIYPCSLLANAELYEYWQRGEYQPYDDPTLVSLVAHCKTLVPKYCRINRVYRDIPAGNIVSGSTLSNLRQEVQRYLQAHQMQCQCIRCREVRGEAVSGELFLDDGVYVTLTSEEHYISYNTTDGKMAGYIRLSLPSAHAPQTGITELSGAALVRELHVYGQALALGDTREGRAQHRGLGQTLLAQAEETARQHGYPRLAVIASVGTRSYYARHGYQLVGTYMLKPL
ncbi:MAG TPA: tRNA uridine(34) 5-carboxymethylaminomethyl modification radical SAM/GNAT enzyme Elp3 [Anaerolineales bacterium]|nr:tRNA uridine(34) 5-carboxymethylaminomethyl modification radical SAM/GNAT enzyme Elp3 [Anaerolineales bacterium]